MDWERILGKRRKSLLEEIPPRKSQSMGTTEGAGNIPEGGNGTLGILWRAGLATSKEIPKLSYSSTRGGRRIPEGRDLGVFGMEGATRTLLIPAQKVGNCGI